MFTCATSRAVHQEMTKMQTAEEFQRKLNAFIARRTRLRLIISDNATVFKATETWIKIRKCEQLQDHLAKQDSRWHFNLSKSPWWGGMYERLIKDVMKTLYKTLGKTHLIFEELETVMVIDIERLLNNRPLTYLGGEGREEQVLTPNIVMWGEDTHVLEGEDHDDDEGMHKLNKLLCMAREHAWKRWRNDYIHSLMESLRVNKKTAVILEIGEIVLV